ncbi:DNA (cytosine-5-)-methyltransferase [Mesorhizobium sp. B2-4-17]|uniref:DNA cytosine methyltransferase n=1 Tax=Mesorhizobium sp. B2-4-17 TaxID=2589932 RepID=UPI001129F4DD|nr:DNA (cytosine-5-)-methyltransferase [Mesorhizobium sp. B2-4-17]TPK91519.1 DNA (cytosine-5-)-methyltransferase [Mesorhizobium sp. B2-4-17]
MEFTKIERDDVEARQDEPAAVIEAEPAQVRPIQPLLDLNVSLHSVKTAVRAQNRRMAEGYTRIATEIERVRRHLPVSKLKTFLTSECGLNRSDIGMYLKFMEVLGPHMDLVTERGLPMTVAKSLIAAPHSVRNEALERIEAGSFIHSSEVSAIKRRQREQAADPKVEVERRRVKALQQSAQRRARIELETFSTRFIFFAQSLIDFFNDAQEEDVDDTKMETRRARLQDEAGRCLREFESVFDTTSLPPAQERGFHLHDEQLVRLARAYDSLRDLAEGTFKAVDEEDGNPFDKDHEYIDFVLVESVIWLFNDNGVSAKDLKRRKLPAEPAAPQKIHPPYRLTSIEICAGAGGQALGLHAAGFDALALYERNPAAAETLMANRWFGPVHCADVTEVDFRRHCGDVDLVAGGVPCQPHSSLGKRQGRDDERDLFMEAVRMVDEVQPRAFFFENVRGFGFQANANYRADLYRKFADLGYESQIFSLNGSDYGLAQLRPRVAFVGFRDVPIKRFQMPPKFPQWNRTVGEVLYDLVVANGWEGAEEWARNHANRRGSTIVGGSEQSGRLAFSSNLRKDDWIDMKIDPFGIADEAPEPGHKLDDLFPLTLEMGARLQGFPDGWEFIGSGDEGSDKDRKTKTRQIANALPPIMAQAVGLAIYTALTGVEFDYAEALKSPELPPQRDRSRLKLSERRDLEKYHRGK